MHATLPMLRATDFPAIRRRTLDTLQVNVGDRCNGVFDKRVAALQKLNALGQEGRGLVLNLVYTRSGRRFPAPGARTCASCWRKTLPAGRFRPPTTATAAPPARAAAAAARSEGGTA